MIRDISIVIPIYNEQNNIIQLIKEVRAALEQKINYEISYKGKIYKSINDLAKHLGIHAHTLAQRIRDGLPEEEWGEVRTGTLISTGYTLEEAPINLKNAAEKLAIGLNISTLEAYQLLLEKIDFTNL